MPKGVYKREPFTIEHKRKLSEARKLKGKNHPNWLGSGVGYRALHRWIERKLGKPKICEHCGVMVREKRLCWANRDHKYRRNFDDWFSCCYKCHQIYDIKNNNYQRT